MNVSTNDAKSAILNEVKFDEGRNARGKIGFVLIPNEQTIEDDMIKHMPPGVGAYFSRATMPREISTESLAQLRGSLANAAARILPDDKLDVFGRKFLKKIELFQSEESTNFNRLK